MHMWSALIVPRDMYGYYSIIGKILTKFSSMQRNGCAKAIINVQTWHWGRYQPETATGHDCLINSTSDSGLRQYAPKKRQMASITNEEIKMIENRLNNSSRKRFGFRTPAEVFHQSLSRVAPRA